MRMIEMMPRIIEMMPKMIAMMPRMIEMMLMRWVEDFERDGSLEDVIAG